MRNLSMKLDDKSRDYVDRLYFKNSNQATRNKRHVTENKGNSRKEKNQYSSVIVVLSPEADEKLSIYDVINFTFYPFITCWK